MMDIEPGRFSFVVEELHEASCHGKESFGKPNGPNDPFCGHLCLLMASWYPWRWSCDIRRLGTPRGGGMMVLVPLDPHMWRSFWILLMDLEDDDTLNKMMMHDDLEGCGDPSYTLGYDQTL